MSAARRPLLTATAAGTLLCALWFVPSANATGEGEAAPATAEQPGASASVRVRSVDAGAGSAAVSDVQSATQEAQEVSLADTGSVDTTPYLIGGTLFLGVGAGFVSFAARRSGRAA
ncbi:hypothetical protein [Streptomyces sp. NPDC059176]|uniref:hypothetical protein n=1 Tax=unclassified Streptomyces TaxID=2593676 RepID=UPI00367DCA94